MKPERWMKIICGLAIGFWVQTATTEAHAQKIAIKGSNTFGEELGPRLIEAYRAEHPGVVIELETKGTATGFAGLLDGTCDIGSASRLINEDELRRAGSRGIRLHSHTIGYYGVAVIVNQENALQNLTDSQIRSVFTGIINRWKALSWVDQPIQTYIRDPVSGTYLGFQELAMERMPYARTAQKRKSYEEIAGAVKSDVHGIGYVGMNFMEMSGVRALKVNGVMPSVQTIAEQTYPYARQLRLYTNAKTESKETRQFIEFILSEQGQNILQKLGYARRFESVGSPFAKPY